MELATYLDPTTPKNFQPATDGQPQRLGDYIITFSEENNFPDLSNIDMAIIGVKEDRNAYNNNGCALAPDIIRSYLYNLFKNNFKVNIADLGNVKIGHLPTDTYYAVSSICEELIQNKILPVIIGGSQDLTYANYRAYENLGQIINIVSIDSCFDLGKAEQSMCSNSFLSHIILHQPNFLFNYANIGYQTYFVDPDAIELMGKLYFDTYRLGVVRSDIEEVEPILRNADVISFDISCIRQSDAPGNGNASPNGFYGEEACRIMRYAGMSDKLTSVGFYEVNPAFDKGGQTSHLVAQMIWYFIEGFYNRMHEYPVKDKSDLVKFLVPVKNLDHEIVFYKSKKSDRWWMEIPCSVNLLTKYERHYLVPCSYKDYQLACKEDIPDRWWQVYQKMM